MRTPMNTARALGLIVVVAVLGLSVAASHAEAVQPGQNLWSQWKWTPQGKDFFPIGVWAQSPRDAGRYKAMGVNYYFALHGGPTAGMMAEMRKHKMATVCGFNDYARKHLLNDPLVWGWMHGDEPDLAHVYPRDTLMAEGGKEIIRQKWPEVYRELDLDNNEYKGWGMGAHPELDIVADYQRMKAVDPSRPVLLQLSRAVATDGKYNGRGDHSGRTDLYPRYIAGADMISYDVYPVANGAPEKLWLVPKGLDNLKKWGAKDKPVMAILEAGFGETYANKTQQRAMAWMAINHGASSITWFCHRWQTVDGVKKQVSTRMPLTDPAVGAAVKAINMEIHSLAAVINSPDDAGVDVAVASSNAEVPISVMGKKHAGSTFVFAVPMRTGETTVTFTVPGAAKGAVVHVINEDRTLKIANGAFTDTFKDFDVHLYKIR